MMRLADLLLGKPLRSSADETAARVGAFTGVGVLGLDALASAAYGPEALLTVLLPLGAGALRYLGMLTAAIVVLLGLLAISYWQTIGAYPNGGGAYTVTSENLGKLPALLAAAALLLDYLLNVAVAISAGVGALISAAPGLQPFTLPLGLGLLALLTLANLRGVRQTGAVIFIPTYLFVGCLLAVLIVGLGGSVLHGASAHQEFPLHAAHLHEAARHSSLAAAPLVWLLVRAFASGCTAMTGVEAVSNGVPIFRQPSSRTARKTLLLIVGMLMTLLLGVVLLCNRYGIIAKPPGRAGYESILSQLTASVFGRGALYRLTIGSIVLVLSLSANTSFTDFPRVCSLLARDGFLPEPLRHVGRRLTFSHGILALSGLSAILLCVFGGVTDRLIPLFAVGALSAFTMSQVGMVQHWRKRRGVHARVARGLNFVGAIATVLAALCALVAKFVEGAWISLLVVGAMLGLFLAVKRHYDFIRDATRTDAAIELGAFDPPLAVVPIRRWEAVSLKALRVAKSLSPQVFVVQVLTSDRQVDDLRPRWQELALDPAQRRGQPAPELVVKESEYRRVLEPLIEFVQELVRSHPNRLIAVVLPELVEARWYYTLLHGRTMALLAHRLRVEGGPQVLVVSTPWYLRDWLPERRWLRQLRPAVRSR
jgi:amino acid transporter